MSEHKYQHMHLGVNTLFHVPGDVGGTETYLLQLLQAIVFEYPFMRITLFAQSDNYEVVQKLFFDSPQVCCVCLPFRARFRPLRIIMEQTLLPLAVYKRGVDVLWSPGYTAPLFASCPQMVTIHDLQYKRHPEDLTSLERFTLDWLVRSACSRCSHIVAVSKFSRQEIIDYGFAPPEKVHATLEGVDQSFAEPVVDSREMSAWLEKVPQDSPFILCVAHTYPHKNVHMLIEAFHGLQQLIPHNLVIVGKPRLGEPKVVDVINRLGDMPRLIRFDQGVSFEHLKYLYQQADLFVLPSEYEGFGLPVLEAQMAGVPVVCPAKASLPEVAGVHAFYVDPLTVEDLQKQIMRALASEPVELDCRIEAARLWAKQFTWSRTAQETVAVLRKTLALH